MLEDNWIFLHLQIMRVHISLLFIVCTYLILMIHTTPLDRTQIHDDWRKRSLSEGIKVLHRAKRGWMWNQFFLLEEYTGSDTQYVGKVSTCLLSFNNCEAVQK